jgi:peptidoglycan/LPS O-acetylase OafA/YrhL
MHAQQDHDTIPAVTHGPRRLGGRRRATGAALAAGAWAATWTAALAGSHPGRAATTQIAFAATMATFAMGETLFPPASSGAAGRSIRIGTLACSAGGMLALAAGGAALGADWGTSLLTTLAVACAIASSVVHRSGRPRSGSSPFRRAATRARRGLARPEPGAAVVRLAIARSQPKIHGPRVENVRVRN